jgi:proteasome lid subunit RPN8/RPN11
LSELPNEGCGLLATHADVVKAVYPMANVDASRSSYTIAPADHFEALETAEANGWELGGVFHSHPVGSAVLSATDIDQAIEPQWVYLVVGLGRHTEIRGWDHTGAELEIVSGT